MADSKATADPGKKEKSSILDDDIGKDILSSRKSISVTEDALDFKLEPIGKSKKKDFSFGNLDMDFDLGGDFGKMSSFKMDMSDLDFSFTSKKDKKSTEKSEGDTGGVNFQGKEDQFNFSFDFNSLGNFDIDATLSKEDTLSRNRKNSQKLDSDRTNCQASEFQDNEVTVAEIVNEPKRGQASETVAVEKVHDVVDTHDTLMRDNHSYRSEVSDDIVLQPGAEVLSDKAVPSGSEDTADHSYLPVDQPIIQNFDVQTISTYNGEGNLVDLPKEGCSFGTGVNTNVGGEQSICYNEVVTLEAVHEQSPDRAPPEIADPLEHISNRVNVLSAGKEPDIYIEEVVDQGSNLGSFPKIVQSETSELSKDYNAGNIIASNTFSDVKESSDGVSDSNDPSSISAVKIVNKELETRLSPLSNREPEVTKSTSGEERDPKIMRSQFFNRSDETSTLNHKSSVFTKLKSVNMRTLHSDSLSQRRETNACEKKVGTSAGADIVSHKNVAKGELTLLRNQRTLITAKELSLHINSSSSKEKSSEKESQKTEKPNMTSIMDCSQSKTQTSVAKDNTLPLKPVKGSRDLTDLKSSRCIEEKKLQSSSATRNEIKSLKVLKHKADGNQTPVVNSLILTEKQKPGTPTLKRKQASTEGLKHETPLKRLSQSHKDTSGKNVSDMKIQEQEQLQNNMASINIGDHLVDMSKLPKFDTPGLLNSGALEIPTDMGSFGKVEKAEAYGKNLDDLCSMLKKKHEEAKELLVRAVINNNNLLLLSHPMHDEKICSVQKLASRLMAMEIVPRPG